MRVEVLENLRVSLLLVSRHAVFQLFVDDVLIALIMGTIALLAFFSIVMANINKLNTLKTQTVAL